MLYAIKGNKRLKIDESQKNAYLAWGYDIAKAIGEKLKVIESTPAKTVPYAKYKDALDKIASLEKELAKVDKGKGGK